MKDSSWQTQSCLVAIWNCAEDNRVVFTDLRSTNGTFLDGRREAIVDATGDLFGRPGAKLASGGHVVYELLWQR